MIKGVPWLIKGQFGTIQNLHRFLIPQTRNWLSTWLDFCLTMGERWVKLGKAGEVITGWPQRKKEQANRSWNMMLRTKTYLFSLPLFFGICSRYLKVSKFQNEFMKSLFLPKYEPGFLPFTVPHYREEILTIFGSYFVRINSFWNLLTFSSPVAKTEWLTK